jgi:N-acyl-D-amino-acid deacylase
MIVAPGFIDVHTHIEGGIEARPTADNFLHMGVTSVITGNCGGSALPLGDWFSKLERNGISINVGSLAGHNTIRHEAMRGDFDRAPTREELQRMREMVAQSMRDGAVGFSTGLEYVPGTYAETDEIVELAKVAASFGGLYATHMRNEDETVEQSIKESLEVGERAKCPVEIFQQEEMGSKLRHRKDGRRCAVAWAAGNGRPVPLHCQQHGHRDSLSFVDL